MPNVRWKTVIVTLKEKEKGTISNLVEKFHKELITCYRHLFNIKHQYRAIRSLKENLSEHGIILHVDFSENYKCKYDSEIQSMHFGASQRQISLHTGMLYTKQRTNGFCSISDCLQHGPAGIWAHLRPVLIHAQQKYANLQNVYVFSDGPTMQYL